MSLSDVGTVGDYVGGFSGSNVAARWRKHQCELVGIDHPAITDAFVCGRRVGDVSAVGRRQDSSVLVSRSISVVIPTSARPSICMHSNSGQPRRWRRATKRTLALTDRCGGTTDELPELAGEIRDGVEARFGVRLRPEARLVRADF
jgi:hypothetical protein